MDLLKDTANAAFGQKIRVRACGLLFADEELLLVNMAGLTKSGSFWLPPGGGVNFGETLETALQREFREETGLEISVGPLLRMHQYVVPPMHALEFFFQVSNPQGTAGLGLDPELAPEKQLLKELMFLPLQKIKQLPEDQLHPILHGLNSYQDLLKSNWNLTAEFRGK